MTSKEYVRGVRFLRHLADQIEQGEVKLLYWEICPSRTQDSEGNWEPMKESTVLVRIEKSLAVKGKTE